ncbi:MAG: A/G-specific adenine glycosylase [Eubacterium sp.]|nr:A/G-specific adenine glycosylase [Eubacterium sp.]
MKNIGMDKDSMRKATSRIVRPLLLWYRENKRSLPWREAPSPYHTWISEIMLQQTRIEAVKEYYRRFLTRLPAISDLAEITEDELLKLWEGLGYYSRARNLKKAAIRVEEEYDGELPADFEQLRSLPGIGNYTAGAIASIAYGLPEPAVDGNVLRVLMRYLNRDDDVMSGKLRSEVEDCLREVMRQAFCGGTDSYIEEEKTGPGEKAEENPAGDFTQALMELGEVICLPNGEPLCEKCPLREECLGREAGRAAELPVRKKKTVRTVEKRTILRLRDPDGRVAIRRRPDSGLLAGMWELPSVDGHRKKNEIPSVVGELTGSEDPTGPVRKMDKARHIFSHREWDMVGYEMELPPRDMVGMVWASPQDLEEKFALPTAFSAFVRHL